MEPSELKSRLDSLPNHAGVYLMKDREGAVIYVGKANRLKQIPGISLRYYLN